MVVTLVLGSEAVCSDGCRGQVRAIVLAPAAGTVTHLVVEPGRRADLVLVDGDPLRDIAATRSLRRVWCGGIGRRPAELDG